MVFPGGTVAGNPSVSAGDISGSGKFPEEGDDYPLQCSCLGNPMDRGAWRATVHRVAKESDNLVSKLQ